MIVNDEYVLKTDNALLPLNTDEVNDHLKESFADITVDALLPALIKAVEKFGEDFTRRVFLTKTFMNYRAGYYYGTTFRRTIYELRRSKLVSIVAVTYVDIDEADQTIAGSNYATSFSDEYSSLYFTDSFSFPSLSTQNPQPLRIEFSAGYGATEASIPKNIKIAMLNHLAKLWKHRGDCPADGKSANFWTSGLLPSTSRMIYSMERIPDIKI